MASYYNYRLGNYQIFMSGILEEFLDMHGTYTFNKTSLLYMCCL